MKAIRCLLFVVLISIIAVSMTQVAEAKNAARLKDGKTISYETMIEDLQKADVIFIGETHDNEMNHRMQLEIIKSLNEKKISLAVGFEMFTADSQDALDKWVAGDISAEDFIPIYYANWNFPWSLYRDIFFYIRNNKITAIGLNVPSSITRKVAKSGFSSLTEEERKKLPPETGCVVSKEYMEFIRSAYAMHGHGGREFLYFCEAQLLWDQAMANNIADFVKRNPGKSVVVLTGSGHAWKKGIPGQLKEFSPGTSFRVVLPDVSGKARHRHIDYESADYILMP